ncbi:MAG: T9SS type A sorting domain-containing protein, partial [Bacteroidales bacterium]|nr:T9SS type A sorting domain-containing protein [Bacteroidales bacterium]
ETTFDENTLWDLEVYSGSNLLQTKQTGLRGRNARIQTAGWKEGVYLVRIIYQDGVLTGKLIVE